MRSLWIAFTAGVVGLFGLALWKNKKSYSWKSREWRIGKSAVDCLIVVLSALYMPALLVGWTVMWLTRGVKRRGIQVSLAVILGVIFSSISGFALEVLCVLGIFGVDLLTGKQGVYGWWKEKIPDDFLPSFKEPERGFEQAT